LLILNTTHTLIYKYQIQQVPVPLGPTVRNWQQNLVVLIDAVQLYTKDIEDEYYYYLFYTNI